ncbi:topoisomerase-associated Zn-finger domain protein [Komagataeibacter medellinensis NBRC 3288]|uniref:Topoisomerase-associated Zn-finger domain protein n=1 Tax=Komagataeibacter medellinensis (strain NBRC 3288 / BCRC 11682 / LMG 1693 / Kondo 51) TaxID=634177 RepID=G2I430_KOMMN|nr:topoisomerase-associated Zn-finger domain protein [Komagataeibacter medellinensis NBRC 3288]
MACCFCRCKNGRTGLDRLPPVNWRVNFHASPPPMLMGVAEVLVGLLLLGWGACGLLRAPAPVARRAARAAGRVEPITRIRPPAPVPDPMPEPAPGWAAGGVSGEMPQAADAGFTVPVSMADYSWAVPLYQPRPLLSAWECRVLRTLMAQVPPGYLVCPQVRLAELMVPRGPDADANRRAFYKIASKSVDFVVVRADDGHVVLGVELDDSTHDQPERQYRDGLVNAAFAQVGITLVHITPGQRVDVTGYFEDALAEPTVW